MVVNHELVVFTDWNGYVLGLGNENHLLLCLNSYLYHSGSLLFILTRVNHLLFPMLHCLINIYYYVAPVALKNLSLALF